MRKSVRLLVRVTIEGEDKPAHDFVALGKAAVRDILAAGAPCHPELKLSVSDVQEDRSDDTDSLRSS